jgi:ATP-dependent RNA helicase RhlB
MQFSDFPLDPRLIKGLTDANYLTCTPVQEATLKMVFEQKRDVYAQSQTGTGKTAAFVVPTLQLLIEDDNPDHFALMLVPTRELAVQVEKEARLLNKHINWSIVALFGGVNYDKQEKSLVRRPRIVVATPGRLIDFAKKGLINLKNAKVLVIDEADRLFDMGFYQDLKQIMAFLPDRKTRHSLLFSATLNQKVGGLAWEHMNDPGSIVIKTTTLAVESITQQIYHVSRAEKMILLLALLRAESPHSAIIFSNTRSGAGQIARRLSAAGYRCALLEGDVPQKKRLRIITDMKEGRIHFLAATDVASRGLHVADLAMVVNFDLPDDPENYVHRIGRTSRAGNTSGRAISFACERYVYNLAPIERLLKTKIPVMTINDELKVVVKQILLEEQARPKDPVRPELAHHRPSQHPKHPNERHGRALHTGSERGNTGRPRSHAKPVYARKELSEREPDRVRRPYGEHSSRHPNQRSQGGNYSRPERSEGHSRLGSNGSYEQRSHQNYHAPEHNNNHTRPAQSSEGSHSEHDKNDSTAIGSFFGKLFQKK